VVFVVGRGGGKHASGVAAAAAAVQPHASTRARTNSAPACMQLLAHPVQCAYYPERMPHVRTPSRAAVHARWRAGARYARLFPFATREAASCSSRGNTRSTHSPVASPVLLKNWRMMLPCTLSSSASFRLRLRAFSRPGVGRTSRTGAAAPVAAAIVWVLWAGRLAGRRSLPEVGLVVVEEGVREIKPCWQGS